MPNIIGAVSDLASASCVPCKGGVPPLEPSRQQELLRQLDPDWKIVGDHHLVRTFEFDDFRTPLELTNAIGELAETEGHHPDLHLRWGGLTVTIWTHKIDGLTESDFVLAAKIDRIEAAA